MAILGCLGDTSAPKGPRPVSFSLAPRFQTRAALAVAFDKVRITLSRGSGTALDTTIAFPPGVDSLILPLSVQISGASETLTLNLAMINAAGDTVFRGGPESVTLTAANTQPALPIPVRYSGVGANARGVRISTKTVSLFFRDSLTLTASALDSVGQPIPGTPIAWQSLDTALARVPSDTLGKVVAGIARGVARIQAMLPTGLADTAQVTVQPVPAALSVISGNAQSGPVGAALAQPLIVRVKAADSLAVQGVAVNFAVASGGGSVSKATDTTASTGNATTTWTLGGVLGAQSVTATVASAPSLMVTLSATSVAGAPKKVAFLVQPSNVADNVAMVPAVQVVAQDSFGNTVTGFTGNVTLAIGANPGSSTLGGTLTVAAVAGIATFSNLTLNQLGAGYTLVASSAGLTSATSGTFNIVVGAASQLAITTQPSAAAQSGVAFAQQPVLQLEDAGGNAVSQSGVVVTAAIATGGGTLGGTLTATSNVSGVATFTNLAITGTVGARTLTFAATGLTSATSGTVTVSAGAATQLAITTQPSAAAQSGVTFAQQPVIQLQDASGNAVSRSGILVTAAIATGGGSLGGTLTATTNASGVATFATLAITGTIGARTLTFTATGLTAATSGTVTVSAGAATQLAITTPPSAAAQSGVAFAQQPVLQLQDAPGNAVSQAGVVVTAAIATGAGTLGGTLTATTSASGVATFTTLAITGTIGARTLTFTATGLTAATSGAVTVSAGAASQLAITTQPSTAAQSGAAFAQQPVLQLQDASGNAVSQSGVVVTAAIATGAGTLGGTLTATTNASGTATFTTLAITGTIGARTLTFTATGLTAATSGTVTLAAGAAAQLAITTQPSSAAQSGVAFAQQPTLQLQDASGNTVSQSGVVVTAAIATGGGMLGGTLTATTNAGGAASFTNLMITGTVGARTLTFTATGLTAATSGTITVGAGAASQLVLTIQPSAAAQSGVAFAQQPVLQLQDASGNAVSQSGVVVTAAIATGGGTLGGTLAATTIANGSASFTNLAISGTVGARTLTFTATGLAAATSGTVTVGAGAAGQLALTTQPSAAAQSGVAFAQQPVLQLEDASGNAVSQSGVVVTAAIATGAGTLGGTLTATTNASGVATFTNLVISGTVGARTLTFSATGLTNATSGTITVSAGAASQLVLTTQPSAAAQSGVAFAQQPVIQLQDASGNAVSQSGVVVTAAIATGAGTLGGTLTATANASGAATFATLVISGVVGARTLVFTATGLANVTSGAVTVSAGAASQLAITAQPSAAAQSGVAFAQQPAIQLQDASGNAVSQSGVLITAAIATGGGTLGGTLTTTTNASGVAIFTNLVITGTIGPRTLSFTATGLTAATSGTVTVSAGAATQLVLTTQPSAAAQSGAVFAQQPLIQLQDASGNAVSQSGVVVTAAVATGGGTLGGTLTATTNAAGAATFTNLVLTGTVGARTLSFLASGLTSATSGTVTLSAGAASQLAITQPSSAAQSGVAFAQQPAIQLQDASGNAVSQSGVVVTAAIATGGGTLGGTLTATTDGSGVATFTTLAITGTVGARTLTFTASGLTAATSGTITVSAGAASQLAIATQPSAAAQSGAAFAQQPVLQLQDASGNAVSQAGVVVTAAIATGAGTLGGTLTATTNASGTATFTNLAITGTVGARTLTFTASGLTAATSGSVTVSAGAASQLAITTQPSAAAQSGAAFAQQPVIQLQDASGNAVSQGGVVVTAAIATGGGTLGGTLTATTNASGTATFTNLSITGTVGGRTLTFTATGLTAATSGTITISAGAASQLVFTTQPPASTTAQTAFGFTVTAEDGGGNTATGFTSPVTAAIATNPAGGTLSGTLTVNAVAGVASFSGISLDNIGAGYTLSASATGLSSATSSAVSILAGLNVNAWINTAGGNWSTAANWSKGAVPVATDTVQIKQSGTYTVNLDVNGTFARLDVGAPSGTQTLSVAANTLTAGNGAFASNTVLNLSGTGTITGAGTLTDAGTFNWTGGSLGAVTAGGTIKVLAGGALSIAPAANVQLQNYALELDGTGTWTGTAFINSGSGGTLRVGASGVLTVSGDPSFSYNLGGATASVLDNLGTILRTTSTNSFVVNVPISGTGSWQVQSGAMNLQEGGTVSGPVTVSAGATLNFFASGFSFGLNGSVSGAGTVNVASGTIGFNSGYSVTGPTLIAGGSAFFGSGTGTVAGLTLSSGLLGVLAPLTVAGTTTWSGGTINISGGPLLLPGGSGATFAGAATVAAGATLDFGGGTFTQTGNLAVSGDALVSAGVLVPAGHALVVGGNFTTTGTGALQMTLAADSVDIAGGATFGGGAAILSGGVLRFAGDFTQTTNATAFAATGTHRTILSGAATQNISFANPTTSFFRRLVVPAVGHSILLQTNVQVTDSLTMLAGGSAATMTGAGTSQRLTVGGLLTVQQSTSSPTLTPPVIELSVTPNITAVAPFGLNADTTVFLGSIAALPISGGIVYNNVRVNTSGPFASPSGNVTFNGDLIVSSGTYRTGSGIDSVAGFLRTEGTGALSMFSSVAVPTLAVRDSAVFAGGPSTSLTAGLLRIWGNFVERGTAGQFAPTGTRVTFQRSTAGAQTIQFADSVNSFFHDLVLSRPIVDTVRMLSNVQVQDSAIVSGSSVLASTTAEALKTPATGAVRVHSGGVLKPSRVEIGLWGSLSADSDFTGSVRIVPDTAVFLGTDTVTSFGPAYGWKNARVGGGTLVTTGTVYNGNLIMSGGMYTFPTCCSGTDSVKGFLRTEGTGTLQLNSGDGTYYLVVRDSAVFGGGDETGLLVNSELHVGGDFVQRGLATSFQAGPNNTTVFEGSSPQTVTFASPGAALSGFGTVFIARASGGASQPAGITLGSNIFVAGSVYDSSTSATDSILGNGFTVNAGGLTLGSQFVMNNAPLITNTTNIYLSGLTFRNMSPTVTQWAMNVPVGTVMSISGLNFQTAPTTPGQYFAALMSGVGSNALTVTGGSPATLPLGTYTYTNLNGSVSVTWNGSVLP